MGGKPRGGIERDRDRRSADGHMRRGHAHQIEKERYGEHRAAAPDQPERDPNERTRAQEQCDGNEPEGHGVRSQARACSKA
jgi:hypothetical protein